MVKTFEDGDPVSETSKKNKKERYMRGFYTATLILNLIDICISVVD